MSYLKEFINEYPDFPKKGINFKDIVPILKNPEIFKNLINDMSNWSIYDDADAIIAIDARGFIFGSAIALNISKPLVLARKVGKLPGILIESEYKLEYGVNKLSIQKNSIEEFENFIIVDDLLATGGTVGCVSKILYSANKKILGLSVVAELKELYGRNCLDFPVQSQIEF